MKLFNRLNAWLDRVNERLDAGLEVKRQQLQNGENDMDTRAYITDTGSAFVLKTFSDETVGTYSRRRDAVRGATRRGLAVA